MRSALESIEPVLRVFRSVYRKFVTEGPDVEPLVPFSIGEHDASA
jgi:hypothetical protein